MMEIKFKNTFLESMEYLLPEKILTSSAIEEGLSPVYQKLKLPKGRLELFTGIKERRVGVIGEAPSQNAILVSDKLLQKSKIKRDEIDVIIYASVCRDFLEPATASVVHHKLGLNSSCQFFDLSNACLGIMQGWLMAGQMIESGYARAAMVVGSENSAPLIKSTIDQLLKNKDLNRKEIKKYMASLTIGSGAFASILGGEELVKGAGHRILAGSFLSDTSGNHMCSGGGDNLEMYLETDSESLLKSGCVLSKKNWERTKHLLGWENDSVEHIITHQVGETHQKAIQKNCSLAPHKFYSTFQKLGNTGSVALPITLAMAQQENRFSKQDRLALLGIGSGIGSIMMGMEW